MDLQPSLELFFRELNAFLMAVIPLGFFWLLYYAKQYVAAHTDGKRLENAERIGEIVVRAVRQDPAIVGHQNAKALAVEAVRENTPGVSDKLAGKLVENAVSKLNEAAANPAARIEADVNLEGKP